MRFTNGIQSWVDNQNRYVGFTINNLRADEFFREVLSLNGGETVEVNSGTGFRAVNNGYVIATGDEVRFSLAAGEKGMN
jgi:hypothetical protein